MLRRIVWLLIAFPAGLLLVTLAVVNRHEVRLVLDPFRPETPVVSLALPFYAYLFITLLLGVLLGGTACGSARPDGAATPATTAEPRHAGMPRPTA